MSTIALPSREILLPRFETPRFLRHLKDDAVTRLMSQRTGSKNLQAGNPGVQVMGGPGVTNVLASVPWVAQWKFNNNGNDSVGTNHLTNNNSATFTTGKLGGATGATQLTAASSQYWSIANNAVLQMGDIDFTIAGWFYFDSVSTYRMLVSKWEETTKHEYLVWYDPATSKLTFSVSNNGTAIVNATATLPSPAVTATWYCIFAWHDSVANTINIQIDNGTIYTTAHTTGISVQTSTFFIGAYSVGSLFHSGRIDNVCIAKSAAGGGGVLSAAQRTAFYNAGAGTETLT